MIKTWQQRCEDHEGIVTNQMILDRMQEEIDELRKAAEMALEALEKQHNWMVANGGGDMFAIPSKKAINELRQALEQQKKEWVGLTDEERRGMREWQEIQKELGPVWAPMMLYLYLAIEAKLKEKNVRRTRP